MGLETASYPSQLVSTNPVGGVDPVSEGDDHIRLLKVVLKTTFPNVNAALNATPTEFNYLVGVSSAIQTQLDAKLATANYTAADVLAKLLTVDGSGSGLDADVLDGQDSSYFTNASNLAAGTIPDARFPATLPAVSGTNLTGVLKTASNLSDVASAAAARANLGVTATGADTTYSFRANNLSDLASAVTARANLGLVIGTNVPSPTGTGASGTWGIDITGTAANATNAANASKSSVPRRVTGWADGECLHAAADQTLNTSDMAAGRTFSWLNTGAAAKTLTQGSGVTLYWTSNGSTGDRTLAARGMCTIRCESGTEAYITGDLS